MDIIRSAQNPSIKHLVRLSESARQRRDSNEVLLDGLHLLAACLDSGQQPQRVYAAESRQTDAELQALLPRLHCTPVWVADAVLARASELKTPTGVLSIYRPQQSQRAGRRQVWLDDVQDPGNVGSILRSAAAAGFDCVHLSPACADAWSPRVLRAGMGAHFVLDIHSQADLLALAGSFAGSLVATSLQDSQSLYELDYTLPVAWLFGNEGEGVCSALQQAATHRARISMPGRVESLNVAAAAAICLFEDVRRRHAHAGVSR